MYISIIIGDEVINNEHFTFDKIICEIYGQHTEGDDLWKGVVVVSRCTQKSDNDDFVYGYQYPKQILSEWLKLGGNDVKDSWQNIIIPSAQWSEPSIRHLQLAVKTSRATELMNSYYVSVIYFIRILKGCLEQNNNLAIGSQNNIVCITL
ncbi:hypothetical protein RhiirA4_479830 [Rhizophagus irregularis]|uniref:Uncharacterized protein n=1 Tax=Rhizophagus irregularis TaxID=588596 RepID=A0A2I1HGZ6_9GLOM|nr:hypothetical protein RhiirA4_479830 [Rhizophagus irregularis]